MQTDRVHIIWPALTSSQRKLAEQLGHSKPEKVYLFQTTEACT